MQDEDSEIVSIYFGEGITGEDAEALSEKITEALPVSSINPIIAEIPCGIVFDGITMRFLSSTRLSA